MGGGGKSSALPTAPGRAVSAERGPCDGASPLGKLSTRTYAQEPFRAYPLRAYRLRARCLAFQTPELRRPPGWLLPPVLSVASPRMDDGLLAQPRACGG
jgi:hypothetical protein